MKKNGVVIMLLTNAQKSYVTVNFLQGFRAIPEWDNY